MAITWPGKAFVIHLIHVGRGKESGSIIISLTSFFLFFFFIFRKIVKWGGGGGGGRNRDSRLRGRAYISVYMHVNVRNT